LKVIKNRDSCKNIKHPAVVILLIRYPHVKSTILGWPFPNTWVNGLLKYYIFSHILDFTFFNAAQQKPFSTVAASTVQSSSSQASFSHRGIIHSSHMTVPLISPLALWRHWGYKLNVVYPWMNVLNNNTCTTN